MKRLKREENGIIFHFVFYFLLAIGLMIFVITNIVPQIKTIEEDKQIIKNIYTDINRIETKGLTFEEFKSISKGDEENRFTMELLKNMGKEFYEINLINKTNLSYKDFLSDIKNTLNNEENKLIIEKQNNQIIKLLPSYSENTIHVSGKLLTDYKFINYVESIIESFNLVTLSSIGINKVVLLEDYALSRNSGDSIEANIYYIPLNLVLKGTKGEIIDFLHFIENVGSIKIIENDIVLNKNFGPLNKNSIPKVLNGDKYSTDYNIFEHQIIDIEKISMKDYIDTSYTPRRDNNFINFIKKTQGNEEFDININLMFYIKGQPTYIITDSILVILNKYNEVFKNIDSLLKDVKIQGIERLTLTKMHNELKHISKEIPLIKKELLKKEKLDALYKKAIKLDSIIEPIYKTIKK